MSDLVAAIDCGTNSTRLLISGPDGETLDRQMHITRLGHGVDSTGRLDADAIERVRLVLDRYSAAITTHGAGPIRLVATSAVRDASNRDDFFEMVQASVGVQPELLSGQEEAALSFVGATAELDPADGPFLVVDIGGGSTEFAYGSAEVQESISVDMGCVRMTEAFLVSDPPRPEELSSCLSVVAAHMEDVVREVPSGASAPTLVGLAGTVSAAAAVEIGLAEYDRDQIHHFELTHTAAEDVFRTLATESLADRLHNPGLEPARAEVIVGGMCVLVQIFRTLGHETLLVSEADILDGLAASLRSN